MPVGAKLIGVGAGIPSAVVTNADLEKFIETSDEWIASRTGIRERRIASKDETASGLAIVAAKDAIAFAQIDPSIIDLIIVATSTPDNLYPSTACMVQAAIGAPRAAAFDLEAACTGIIYALAVGQQFVGSGTFKTVLVVGVDIHSRFLNWKIAIRVFYSATVREHSLCKPRKKTKCSLLICALTALERIFCIFQILEQHILMPERRHQKRWIDFCK